MEPHEPHRLNRLLERAQRLEVIEHFEVDQGSVSVRMRGALIAVRLERATPVLYPMLRWWCRAKRAERDE